jgi:hypothetical protein
MATLPDAPVKLATLEFLPTADPNVLSILIAQATWLVFKKSAKIPAQELALPLPDVKSFRIDLLVLVHQVPEVILMSQDVPKYLQTYPLIPAHLVHAGTMLFAKDIKVVTELPHANVFKDTLVIHSCLVALNVHKTQTAQAPKFAQIKSVSTLAQDYVESMQSVECPIMYPDATVCKDTLEILPFPVTKYLNLSSKKLILAIPILVVSTVMPENRMELVFAHAYQSTLEIHQIADLNVWSMQNVAKIWPVLIKNAKLHVLQAFVVLMLNVPVLITMPFAHACQVTKEPQTLSFAVIEYLNLL